ncbi:MAG: rhodanese-like domain-containing protein [Bacteroidota bacterium]|nr:rhodanese-like domain-containing protein [Bacteroidota bacterium]
MIEIFKPKNSFHEALIIIVFVLLIAIVYNTLSPKGIALLNQSPIYNEVSDSLLFNHTTIVSDTASNRSVSLSQLQRLITTKSALIIDARNPEAYQEGHIPTAINIPYLNMFDYMSRLVTIPTDTPIVIYCEGVNCELSTNLAKAMKDMNFKRVFIYHDGMEGWEKAK